MKTIATAVLGSLAIGSVSAIFGGEEVSAGKYSYTSYLSFSNGGDPACGAVLIDSRHVLTLASCLDPRVTRVTVGAQSYKNTSNADVFTILEKRIHPKYLARDYTYDFAVLKLEKESQFSPVKLPNSDDSSGTVKSGDSTTALGWGGTKMMDHGGLSNLHSVVLPVIENGVCRDATGLSFVDRQYLCAGGVVGKGLNGYDVGGPLILKDKPNVGEDMVVGVASYAQESRDRDISVYKRVSAEVSWIRSQLQ